MSHTHTKIPSPARSQGAALTPRRDRSRRTRSVGSPARSNASGRLSTLIQEYREKNMESFVLSPLVGRSLLTDNTDIEEPRRKSWWKKLDENSRDVMEILEENQQVEPNNIIEELDIEVLSQENKKNYTLDMPESSGSESINSIVIPQRKLFTQKEKPQKKFGEIVGTRDTLAKLHKTHAEDKAVNVEPRKLFQNKQRSKPIFPAALLNISPNKTTGDKTREFTTIEPKGQVRNIFGNRQGTKRKNMFANFVVSESEDEIPEIQPKIFGFNKKPDLKRHDSLSFRGHRDPSPTSSITTEMEFDEWRLLPSSTMVENQLEIMVTDGQTPKRAKLSKLSEIRESVAGTNSDATDKTKQSNKSTSSKNKSKTKKSPDSNKSVSNKSKSNIIQKDDEDILDKPQNKSKAISPNTDVNISNSSILTRSRNKVAGVVDTKQNESINKSRNNASNIKNTSKKISQKQNMTNVEKQQESKEHTAKENIETYSDEHNDDEQNFRLEYENDDNEVEMSEVNQQKQIVINKSNKEANASKTVSEKEADSRNNSTANVKESNKKFQNTKSNKIVEESTEEPSTQDNDKINMSKDQQNTSQTKDTDEKMVEADEKISLRLKETSKENNEAITSDAQIESEKQEESTKETISQNKSNEEQDEKMEVDENAGMESQEIRNESQVNDDDEIEEHDLSQKVEENYENEENEELNEIQQLENKTAGSYKSQENEKENDDQKNESEEGGNYTEENNESQEMEQENDDQNDESKKVENETEESIKSYEIAKENDDQKIVIQEIVNENAENNESQEIDQENKSQAVEENCDEQENDDQQVEKHDENDEINNSQEILNKSNQVEEEIEESNEQDVSQEIEQESDNEQNESQEIENESENDYNESQEVENEDENEEEELNESQEEQNESQEVQNETEENASEAEVETEEQNESQEEQNESQGDNEREAEMETDGQNESQEVVNESQEAESGDEEHNVSQEVVNESDEMESDQDGNNESDQNAEGIDDDDDDDNHEQSNEEIEQVETETPNESHDTTGRNRKKVESPEVILHDATNQMESFAVRGRNTSIRKTKSMINPLNIRPRPSLAPARESTGFSDGTKNSSAEGSGWDSHRTTRKTLRQTFGKDFTPRKSLRTLVMEKSAKRQTVANDLTSVTAKFPQANSTELPEVSSNQDDFVEEIQESDHEISRRTRLTTLEMYLQNIQKKNMEEKLKMEEAVLNSLKAPFKVPAVPMFPRRTIKPQTKQKSKKKTAISLEYLPTELIEDMQYKPPKRFQPRNAPWVTKRLYKYLETKLEPRYDYRARVRAEKLVESIYNFAKDMRRHKVASSDAVDVLKHEMARLNVVKTHFEFYEFFHEFMPREIQIKVVPDIINEIPLPRQGIFADILRVNTVQG